MSVQERTKRMNKGGWSTAERNSMMNEILYKQAEYLLTKMQERGLINAEEREKIRLLNIETFSQELAKVYL